MKLKDITVGGEYLYNTSRDWQVETLTGDTSWGNRRVRVLDAVHQMWVYNTKTNAYEKGGVYSSRARKGILVQILDPETGEAGSKTIATLASLRGPWAETSEQVNANRVAKSKAANLAKAAKGVRQGVVRGALALAEKLGVKACCERYDDDGNISVSPAVFLEMLSALEAAGWKAELK